jgi:hypothetical protein
MFAWLTKAGDSQWEPDCDISIPVDNRINILDLSAISRNWGVTAMPAIPGDFDKDGDVDRVDLAIFTSAWLSEAGDTQWNPDCDIKVPADNYINMLDFVVLSGNWGLPPIPGDFDKNGDVDRVDLAIFTSAWLSEAGDDQWNPDCDIRIPADNRINMLDFVVFSENWSVVAEN